MAKLIDKDALVAEIVKCKKDIPTGPSWGDQFEDGSRWGQDEAYNRVLRFIDTLEVKEVNLEKIVNSFVKENLTGNAPIYTKVSVVCILDKFAKHFFELGLKVNNEKEK